MTGLGQCEENRQKQQHFFVELSHAISREQLFFAELKPLRLIPKQKQVPLVKVLVRGPFE